VAGREWFQDGEGQVAIVVLGDVLGSGQARSVYSRAWSVSPATAWAWAGVWLLHVNGGPALSLSRRLLAVRPHR
jgi:hypothetical protein